MCPGGAPYTKATKEAAERAEQNAILAILGFLPRKICPNRCEFKKALAQAAKAAGVRLKPAVMKAVLAAFTKRDESASSAFFDGTPVQQS